MPVSTLRLSSRGRPPWGPTVTGGKTGSIKAHNPSSSTAWPSKTPPYQDGRSNTEEDKNIMKPIRDSKVLLETLSKLVKEYLA